MKRLSALKMAGVAAVIVTAVFIVHWYAGTGLECGAVPEVQFSVSKADVGKMGEVEKTMMYADEPPNSDRAEWVITAPKREITPQTDGVAEVKVATTPFLVYGKDIYALGVREEGKWEKIAEFPIPGKALFKKYRPKTKMWSYETEIGPSTGGPSGIWAGYKFYSGEGFNGIGGAVYYGVDSRELGVLRHPALVDCAIESISVADDRLTVRTHKQGEGSSTVCNGVVSIDLKTLKAVSYFPKESQVIYARDPAPGEKLLGNKYNAPLEKVLSGEAGFEKKEAPNWSDAEREKILAEGLVPYMVRTAREEIVAGSVLGFTELAAREFGKVYKGLTDIRPLPPKEVELTGKNGAEQCYCACAIAQDPGHRNYDYALSVEENAKHSRVGCFLMSETRPNKILKLTDVPTRRWHDYTGECGPGEAKNEVVVKFKGETYGDQVLIQRYLVSPDTWTSELICESAGEP